MTLRWSRHARFAAEVTLVCCVGVFWLWMERALWWGVWHHLAQSLGDATILLFPICSFLGGAHAFTNVGGRLDELSSSASRPRLRVRGRQASMAARSSFVGSLLAAVLGSGAVVSQGPVLSSPILHLGAFVVTCVAGAVIGFATAVLFRSPVAIIGVSLACLVIPRALTFAGGGTLGRAFVADEIGLGASVKAPAYLAGQIAVMAVVICACLALVVTNWSAAVVWSAFAAGIVVLTSQMTALQADARLAAPTCSDAADTTVCVPAIHQQLLGDYVDMFATPVEVASLLDPIDYLIEDGATRPEGAGPDDRIVRFTGRRGFDDQVDLPDRSDTMAEVLPFLVGVERCPPVIIPDDFEQPEPGHELIFDASPQGEIFIWYLGELSERGYDVPESSTYLEGPYESTGIAAEIGAIEDRELRSWFEERSSAITGCAQEL